VQKAGSGHYIQIPETWVTGVYDPTDFTPAILLLAGRLQWTSGKGSLRGMWKLLPEAPPSGADGQFGFDKIVSVHDTEVTELQNRFGCQWIPRGVVPTALAQGMHVFYGADGRYLRMAEDNRILLSPRP
jgi:hypothetical protein